MTTPVNPTTTNVPGNESKIISEDDLIYQLKRVYQSLNQAMFSLHIIASMLDTNLKPKKD